MNKDALKELSLLMLDELGQVGKQVQALPQELQTKVGPLLSQVEQATQKLTEITQTVTNHAGQLEANVKKTIDASVETTKAELAKAVAHTAEKVAYNASRKQMLQWAATCAAVATAALLGMYYFASSAGYQEGYADGRLHTDYDEKVCAWSQSQEGQMAQSLASKGVLRSLYLCEGPGWKKEIQEAEGKSARFCVPSPVPLSNDPKDKNKTQIWGWQLP